MSLLITFLCTWIQGAFRFSKCTDYYMEDMKQIYKVPVLYNKKDLAAEKTSNDDSQYISNTNFCAEKNFGSTIDLLWPSELWYSAIFTSHVSDVLSVLVLALSVCVSVRLSHSHGRTDRHTNFLAWMSSGRISRSSLWVKVIGQRFRSRGHKMFNGMFHWLLRAIDYGLAKEETQYYWEEYKKYGIEESRDPGSRVTRGWYIWHHIWMVGPRHGVFSKHMCFFFVYNVIPSSVQVCVFVPGASGILKQSTWYCSTAQSEHNLRQW